MFLQALKKARFALRWQLALPSEPLIAFPSFCFCSSHWRLVNFVCLLSVLFAISVHLPYGVHSKHQSPGASSDLNHYLRYTHFHRNHAQRPQSSLSGAAVWPSRKKHQGPSAENNVHHPHQNSRRYAQAWHV